MRALRAAIEALPRWAVIDYDGATGETPDGPFLGRDEVLETIGVLTVSGKRCTFHEPFGPKCNRPEDHSIHVRENERMRPGAHVFRATKDGH